MRRLQANRSVPPRPALLISRRAEGTATVGTRGWIGGASRREILSIKPETLLCAVFETVFKSPRSLSPQVRRRVTQRYRLVKLHIASWFVVILTTGRFSRRTSHPEGKGYRLRH